MHVFTDERCTAYSQPGHPERPARVRRTLELLKSQSSVSLHWGEPAPVETAHLLLAHSDHLLEAVEAGQGFDADTPAYPDIGAHARRAVGGALAAMRAAREGKGGFSLFRPPGHHATQDRAMGFCYFNSIAISVLQAVREGAARVGVLDFDVHHGNGTEAILLNHPQVFFASIHQHPCYPGTGFRDLGKNCFNYPMAPRTPRLEYRKKVEEALDRLCAREPELIAVSAGFDAYARDPLADESLEAEDFQWIGERIRKKGIPAWSVLEGGYSDDLPELILAYLSGLQ